MQIPAEILTEWKGLRDETDCAQIALLVVEKTSYDTCSAETIQKVFRLGKCSTEIFKVMADFYKERKSLITDYLTNPPIKQTA